MIGTLVNDYDIQNVFIFLDAAGSTDVDDLVAPEVLDESGGSYG